MEIPSKALRQDVIQNAVNHQTQELEDSAPSRQRWRHSSIPNLSRSPHLAAPIPRNLSRFRRIRRVPLNPEQLQDVLEAAFERDEALAVEFLEEVRANNGPQTLPDSSIQIVEARASDSEHPTNFSSTEPTRPTLRD